MANTELNGADEAVVGPIREALKAAEKSRSVRFSASEAAPPSSELPSLVGSAGKMVVVNATADGLEFADVPSGGGGGLTHFTEEINSSSPNATVTVASLTATDAATNVDLVLSPKGTGAIMARVPNGTSSGGDKRGAQAIDFSRGGSFSNRVASGYRSAILSGYNLQAAGNYSIAVGGVSHFVTGDFAVVLGGDGNTVAGAYGVAWGKDNTASGDHSVAIGENAHTRGIRGGLARSAGKFSINGDAQTTSWVLRRQSTSATPVGLSAGNAASSLSSVPVLPGNSAFKFRGIVIAKQTTGDVKSWDISGTIKRGTTAADTALVGTPAVVSTDADVGAAAWTVAVTANTTLGSLEITATGEASKTIRWVCYLESVEVQ